MTVWRAVGLGLCAVLVALAAWTGREAPSPVPAAQAAQAARPAAVSPSPRAEAGPRAVLRAWDRRRAAAWAAGDAELLGRLYLPGSRAGRSDVRLLGEYAARGVRVRRLTTQVFVVDVVGAAPGRWRLRVVDRVAGGELVVGGRVRALRSGPVVTRRVELVRRGDGWRVGRSVAVG